MSKEIDEIKDRTEIFGEYLARVFVRNKKILNVALFLPYCPRASNYPKIKKLSRRWRLVPFEIKEVEG